MARPEFPPWLPPSGSGTLAGHYTAHGLGFCIFKVGTILSTSQGWMSFEYVHVPRNASLQSLPFLTFSWPI